MPILNSRKSLDFLGFPDYLIDNYGTVWSCRSQGGGHEKWHTLRLWPTKKNYLRAQLYEKGERKFWLVHHLVLLAFVGPKPFPNAQGRHLNDIKTDNHLHNLAWGTQEENMADLKRNGKFPSRKGESNSAAKLTEEQVAEIRRLYVPRSARRVDRKTLKRNGGNPEYRKYTVKKLAEMYGVSISCISFVVYGKHWMSPPTL